MATLGLEQPQYAWLKDAFAALDCYTTARDTNASKVTRFLGLPTGVTLGEALNRANAEGLMLLEHKTGRLVLCNVRLPGYRHLVARSNAQAQGRDAKQSVPRSE